MKEALAKLWAVQEIDTAILEVRKKLAQLDAGKTLEQQTQAVVSAHEQADKHLKSLQADLHDSELEQKSVEQKKEKFKQKLYSGSITNAKELENTEKEVEALGRQSGKLDEKILGLWDSIEEAKKAESEARQGREQAEAKLKEYQEKYQQYKTALESNWGKLNQARTNATAKADAPLLAKYEANRQKHGGIGLSKVVDDRCSACGNAIPSFTLNRLKEGTNQIITCENCSRMLYLP